MEENIYTAEFNGAVLTLTNNTSTIVQSFNPQNRKQFASLEEAVSVMRECGFNIKDFDNGSN